MYICMQLNKVYHTRFVNVLDSHYITGILFPFLYMYLRLRRDNAFAYECDGYLYNITMEENISN